MKPFTSVSSPLGALAMLASFLPTNGLHFYFSPSTPKCFYEELPKDTVVVGHYSTAIYDRTSRLYQPAEQPVEIAITIDELFDSDHRVFNVKSPAAGKFTFTAHDSGDHKFCFTAVNAPGHGGWLTGGASAGAVKFTLDMVIGDSSEIEGDNSQLDEITAKVRELNVRLENIKREQIFQREREAEFRDLSDATKSRVTRWTIIQLVVLGVTCAWQLSHLRNFFIKQKLT